MNFSFIGVLAIPGVRSLQPVPSWPLWPASEPAGGVLLSVHCNTFQKIARAK
jgi:hypothetical protein